MNVEHHFRHIDALDDLPVKRCEGRYCANEGPSSEARIVFVGPPIDDFVGWCDTCGRFTCAHCAWKQTAGEREFWDLDDADRLKDCCLRLACYPVTLRCRHCGDPLGEKDDVLILVNQADEPGPPAPRQAHPNTRTGHRLPP
jgi:hypothetical protein